MLIVVLSGHVLDRASGGMDMGWIVHVLGQARCHLCMGLCGHCLDMGLAWAGMCIARA